MDITELLTAAVQAEASDLHLKSGNYPMMRVHGELRPIVDDRRLEPATMDAMAAALLPAALQSRLAREHEVDFAYSIAGLGRFRCNVFHQRGTVAMALRVIPMRVSSIDDLELPPILKTIADGERGLVLLTGTTGSGKSTTLAALIDHINHTRAAHIMTVEDPIEYLHRDHMSIINQREVNIDTQGFAQALRSSLRQDPDVILVGEMRDLETVETGMTAAETGHLVMSTVHTLDATETIGRLIAVFPPHQHRQVRLQLASVLRAVVSQRLLPRIDRTGRSVAVEVMRNTPFVRQCIVDPERTHLIRDAIAAGTSQYGTQTFDQSIYALCRRGRISTETGLQWATNPDEFKLRLQGVTSTAEVARDEMSQAPSIDGDEPLGVTRFGD
jgi:twitching motility protein PilT